jgi:predicted permease
MAPVSNRSGCKYSPKLLNLVAHGRQSIIQVILVCTSGYVLARRGIIDKPTQKVVTLDLIPRSSHLLISFTATEHYKRQLLHSLSPLLQSGFLPLSRSVVVRFALPISI